MSEDHARRLEKLRDSQNFLHKRDLVEHIVKLAHVAPGDTVLEIGAGRGIITFALRDAVGGSGRVIAIELDPKLAAFLRGTFSQQAHVVVVETDFLTVDLAWLPEDYVAFANVPFAITSAVLDKLFQPRHWPRRAHLILERAAIESTLPDGSSGPTLKSLAIAPWYSIAPVYGFDRSDFAPRPAVNTALFAFERRASSLIDVQRYDAYRDFLAAVSKDRVGEGIWKRILSARDIGRLAEESGLVVGRGIKAQSAESISAAFRALDADRKRAVLVHGAADALREEQARREQINERSGHRRKTRDTRRPQ
ncbi:MAG: rRNA adenine N(6)-methyltransferase family protein [Chloroflexi bacterium]|nr:rRNA adenine N(6)-methyltransferase family protein [Chloroflexota bacterium]